MIHVNKYISINQTKTMPRLEETLVVVGVPCNQTTIYDLPVADLVPTTIQSSANTKDTLKKPLLSNPDMNRTNQHTLETRPYRGDDDKNCCDSCCEGVCSDETLCLCLLCCCMCDN
jgi:hypothetical protein